MVFRKEGSVDVEWFEGDVFARPAKIPQTSADDLVKRGFLKEK